MALTRIEQGGKGNLSGDRRRQAGSCFRIGAGRIEQGGPCQEARCSRARVTQKLNLLPPPRFAAGGQGDGGQLGEEAGDGEGAEVHFEKC